VALNWPVQVRPVTRADFAQWKPLWDGYNAFYGRSGPTALPADVTDATWARFFDPEEPVLALVAEDRAPEHPGTEREPRLIGLTHFLYHRSTIQIAPTCYLADLFTADAARGRGVGRALIAAVYEHAGRAGVPRVYWQTHESNAVARGLYDRVAERSGFIVYRHSV
jgi:GNAT superfamily N-acetyltransferase